jgi:hypothetical protein
MSTVYVLSMLNENELRPVAVVTDEHVAEEWGRQDDNNDYILFELNDLSLTGLGSAPPFKPGPKLPTPALNETEAMRRDTIKTLKEANAELRKTVTILMDQVKQLRGKKKESSTNPLFQKETE